ncbi:MAG: SAM-dependent chlorinase/fluorinase [Acidimicrobiaceae bacterium]|nr:SAM-dependent chlorinase/fluorinase [Acidimicrobiaceae bacterium]MYD07134.1 SAM-dependent chlorinase/fluorinase [Acidimicrobiaceae bacterium]MYI59757.1 SAM-dependent chlorinase/fluorinase [Acidimicrobiaceae bacterium]
MAARFDTISFLSDYGHEDEFVGVVHSVIRSIAPHVAIIDVTHGITPHDTRAGGLALARAANYLCPGVVVAVVDPGVGTRRRAVAIEVGDGASYLIGPDNGLLAPAVGLVGGATRAIELTSQDHRLPLAGGATFDGRDVFAPAAAHLCNGVPLEQLGEDIDTTGLVPGVLSVSQIEGDELVAEVLWIDRFGNCQLNVDPADIDHLGTTMLVIMANTEKIGMRTEAYDQIPTGRAGLMVDSSGLLSLAIARGSAASEFNLAEGDEIRLAATDGQQGGATIAVEIQRKEHRR